jgi:hypothetical protein
MAIAPPAFYVTPGREPSLVLGKAFAEGCGGDLVDTRFVANRPAAFYGVSKYTLPIFQACQARGLDHYYVDNGYFRPGHFDGYFRITRNAPQHSGIGRPDYDRWKALGLAIKPWRTTGRHVLVIGQSRTYFELRGERPVTRFWDIVTAIAEVTDRPILYRPKPTASGPRRSLAEDLRDAWCVVAFTSNVAVEALLEGIPVFVTGDCAARVMGETDLGQIETPRRPDTRDEWAAVLAANQWTVDEIRSGKCWRDLHV